MEASYSAGGSMKRLQLCTWTHLLLVLIVPNLKAQIIVGANETVQITESTEEPIQIQGGTLVPTDVTLSGTLTLEGDSLIDRQEPPQTREPTRITGVIQGSGDLTLQNTAFGVIEISGANTYTGHTLVQAGRAKLNSPTAFGAPDVGTTIRGYLILAARTAEPFRVEEGGTIRLRRLQDIPEVPIDLAGGTLDVFADGGMYNAPIRLSESGGRIALGENELANNVTGSGLLDLAAGVVTGSIAHDGDVQFGYVELRSANSYSGKTTISKHTHVYHSRAFGENPGPIYIEGILELHRLPRAVGSYQVDDRGHLIVSTNQTIGVPISLADDALLHVSRRTTSDIQVLGDASIRSGILDGSISGPGNLNLGSGWFDQSVIELNAANDIRGLVTVANGGIRGESLLSVNHPDALNLTATVFAGHVDLNVQANGPPIVSTSGTVGPMRLNQRQSMNEPWWIEHGTLELNERIGFQDLLMEAGGFGIRQRGPGVQSTSDGWLELNGKMVLRGDTNFNATIRGDGRILSHARQAEIGSNLRDFEGELHIERGRIQLSEDGSLGQSPIYLKNDAHLQIRPANFAGQIVSNDIFVVPGDIPARPPQLHMSRLARANIDVGEGSPIIGSTEFWGQFIGQDVTLKDVTIKSTQKQLTGTVTASRQPFDSKRAPAIALEGLGNLIGAEKIVLESYAGLALSESNTLSPTAQIESHGGWVELRHTQELDRIHLASDNTGVISQANWDSLLTVREITREPGALMLATTPLRVLETELTDSTGMVAPWLSHRFGFLRINAEGILEPMPITNSIDQATAADYVRAHFLGSLDQDLTVNAIRVDGPLDLASHRLHIVSGGLRGSFPTGGTITAGDGTPAELIMRLDSLDQHWGSSIVDNGEEGPVSVVLAPFSNFTRVNATAPNSYTGGTWLTNAPFTHTSNEGSVSLRIENLDAVPHQDRVHIFGGRYELAPAEPGTIHLSSLQIANGGSVAGGDSKIHVDDVLLQDGMLEASLLGTGHIIKDTLGSAHIQHPPSPGFAGSVDVRDGRLTIFSDTLPQARIAVTGGILSTVPINGQSMPNEIELAGGMISGGRFDGPIHVTQDSFLDSGGLWEWGQNLEGPTSLLGKLRGESNLHFVGSAEHVGIYGDASEFRGGLFVDDGTLEIGSGTEFGVGTIEVATGATLRLAVDGRAMEHFNLNRSIRLKDFAELHTNSTSSYGLFPPPEVVTNVAMTVTGDVIVENNALIGSQYVAYDRVSTDRELRELNRPRAGLNLAGTVQLHDGANVMMSERPDLFSNEYVDAKKETFVEISGTLEVGEDTTWYLRRSSLGVTGWIKPRGNGSINFRGAETSLDLSNATFLSSEDNALRVLINGKTEPINLHGSSSGIIGDGSIESSIRLSDSSVVSPGDTKNEIGTLGLEGNLTIGTDAVLLWDLNLDSTDAEHRADLLEVTGQLAFDIDESASWFLGITTSGFHFEEAGIWPLVSAAGISAFEPTDVSMRINSEAVMPGNGFSVFAEGNRLFLEYSPDLLGDCNSDRRLSQADLSCVGTMESRDSVLGALASVVGDFDGNKKVDFGDFLILSTNFGKGKANYTDGDADLSGGVEFGDFLILSQNFGFNGSKSNALASVPEPNSSFILCFLMGGILLLARKSGRS